MMGNIRRYLNAGEVKQQAYGKWSSILKSCGISTDYLKIGKHMPCPICGGNDRYRFDDKSVNLTYYCNNCGHGNGVDLVMKVHHIGLYDALVMIDGAMGGVSTTMTVKPLSVERETVQRGNERNQTRYKILKSLMKYTSRTPTDNTVDYWDSRGIKGMKGKRIDNIQYGSIAYGVYGTIKNDGKYLLTDGIVGLLSRWGEHPIGAIQIYLEPEKIEPFIAEDKTFIKKPLLKAQSLAGSGVWFAGNSKGRLLHVVEGLENALVIAQLMNTRHVVATITGALMQGLVIPDHVQGVYIWCDSDKKGIASANKLKDRYQGTDVTVQSPKAYGGAVGDDWNDLLKKGLLRNVSTGFVASKKKEYIANRT